MEWSVGHELLSAGKLRVSGDNVGLRKWLFTLLAWEGVETALRNERREEEVAGHFTSVDMNQCWILSAAWVRVRGR